jgi:DNA-binding SARP family transcriptional activator/tetratricopeptide (TPR) repeat protein
MEPTVRVRPSTLPEALMDFRILGPLEVSENDRVFPLGAPKERALLASLLLRANRVVATDRLIEVLWGAAPPDTARATLQTYVLRLRRALRPVRGSASPMIATSPPGYVLQVRPDQVDLHRFERLVAEARTAMAGGDSGDMEKAAERLRQALGLWRGPALGEVASMSPLLMGEAARLEEARYAALDDRIEAELALGWHARLVGEVEALVGAHPERERLRRQLMVALYRSGRQAEALAVYRSTRQFLVQELGVEPSRALQELERAILRADPALEPALPAGKATLHETVSPRGPCQLPPDIDDFTGREAAVAEVQQLLEAEPATAIVISAIAGKAGVGKTALAVRVAHRLRPRFADGQLYVNLRGAEGQALDPAEVLAGFLRALGVEGAVIADGLEERVRLYRSRLGDRRVLVVLDNAASEAQVRPLLPGSPGCAALVTSRSWLSGLEAAHLRTLEVLQPDQAVELLVKLTGPARVAAEPQAAQAIVRLCGYLPLAVRIAGAKLASRPHWRLALLAERLADERRRLDELATGDLEVRASVALSYQGRNQEERRLFRLLGLLVAPSFPAWVAAALLKIEPAEAEGLLERLVDAQLVEAAGQDQAGQLRYRLHDLLRLFATERLQDEEPARARRASLERLLDDYLTVAERADALLDPSGLGHYGGGPAAGRQVNHPAVAVVARDPLRWFDAERASLVAAVQQAGDAGLWEPTWRLAEMLGSFLQLRARWDDWEQTHSLALAAARRAGDHDAEGRILASLSDVHGYRYRADEAIVCLHQSVEAFRETGNRRGELQSLFSLGSVDLRLGRLDAAAARFEESLAGFRELGWRSGEALVLYDVSELHRQQGRLQEATACLEQSLTLMGAIGDRSWEAPILRRLALTHGLQGRFGQALACLERSLALVRAAGDRQGEAHVLQGLGEVHCQQGCLEEAAGYLEGSLAFARATGDRAVEAYALYTLGEVRRQQGRLQQAAGYLEGSLASFRELGHRSWEARALNSLGRLHAAKGDPAAASSAWRPALTIFGDLRMPEATEVAARLDRQRS